MNWDVNADRPAGISVLHGPGVELDFPRLRERFGMVGAQADPSMDVDHAICDDEQSFLVELEARLQRKAGLIVSPGALALSPILAAAVVEAAQTTPTVWVELEADESPRDERLSPLRIHGRGIDGYLFAVATIAAQIASPREIIRYGAAPDQFASLRIPDRPGPHAVVALLHGGGWRDIWGFDRTEAIAADLVRRGYATWNMEFRRIGVSRDRWQETFNDVAAALDTLAELSTSRSLDLNRCVVLGHSSGGHLALWTAARRRLKAGEPGAKPRVVPHLVISLAGLGDLVGFARRRLDNGSAILLVDGTPEAVPERYNATSPRRLLPLGVPQLLVHAAQDSSQDLNDLGIVYRDAARAAGDPVEFVELPSIDHPGLIDPRSAAWQWIAAELERRVPALS